MLIDGIKGADIINDELRLRQVETVRVHTQRGLVAVPIDESRCADIIVDELWLGEVRIVCIHTQLEIDAVVIDDKKLICGKELRNIYGG